MTEVVGNAGVEEDVEVLGRVAEFKSVVGLGRKEKGREGEEGTLRGLWKGVLDDVFGGGGKGRVGVV